MLLNLLSALSHERVQPRILIKAGPLLGEGTGLHMKIFVVSVWDPILKAGDRGDPTCCPEGGVILLFMRAAGR